MGNNRSMISESIMTSVFTLLGAAITYFLFNKENEKNGTDAANILTSNTSTLSLFLIVFPLSLLYGGHIGSQFRVSNENIDRILIYNSRLELEKLDIWKKMKLDSIEINNYYTKKMYDTWSENEKKRFETVLKEKSEKNIPETPNYE